MRLFKNLTPCIPLSLGRRGGRDFREGGEAPLSYSHSPLPPDKFGGKGVRGIGLLIK